MPENDYRPGPQVHTMSTSSRQMILRSGYASTYGGHVNAGAFSWTCCAVVASLVNAVYEPRPSC